MTKSFLAFLFACLLSGVPAMAVPAEADHMATLPVSAGGAVPTARNFVQAFKQIGAYSPIQLQGVDDEASLTFGVRLDEVVTRAHLKLNYTYSPALIPQLSHLKIYLNDEVVAVVPLPKEHAGENVSSDIDIDPRYLTDFNNLRFQLIGHYTMECEDPMHSSIWANISNLSQLELTLQPLVLQNDLALLPAPFFDRRDNRRLTLPFVFAARPSLATLRAAGEVSSWFGALSSYRGARFPAQLDQLPMRNAVVFASNDERPQSLKLDKVQGPTISIISHPDNPAIKLLLIQGRDGNDLKTAADALVLGQAVMSGQTATITAVKDMQPRQPYDAPNWVRTDRPVKMGELVNSTYDLQGAGHRPPPVRVNLRVPSDLFTWRSKGVPMDLRYRYTPPLAPDNSVLNISINDQFLESFRLQPSGRLVDKDRLVLPLLDSAERQAQEDLTIPAFRVGSNNQLQFGFMLDYNKRGRCMDVPMDKVYSAIDPDSTIDLSGFPHYAVMPNLAFFANGGFPFTKYADLAQTTVVLADAPDAYDIETMLTALGELGQSTGYPGTRFQLINAAALEQAKDTDILLVGVSSKQKLLAQWGADLPAAIDGSRRALSSPMRYLKYPYQWLGLDTGFTPKPEARTLLEASGPLAALVGFQSPLQAGRSVVAITASSSPALLQVLDALESPAMVNDIKGDVALIRGKDVGSFPVGEIYHVGHLPFWLLVWYLLSDHPVLLALLGILAGIVIASGLYLALKRVVSRRMPK